MAQDKYIIRPLKTTAEITAGIGANQSCLGSDAETLNRHVHRVGGIIYVPAHCKSYNIATGIWTNSAEHFDTVHGLTSVEAGATGKVVLGESSSKGVVIANLPDGADAGVYATLVQGQLYYCGTGGVGGTDLPVFQKA